MSWGAGLRAAQSLILGSKARALLRGRFHVAPEDIRALIHPTFRHRILLGYRAEADGVTVDAVIDRLLEHVKGPSQMTAALRPPRTSDNAQRTKSELIDPQTLMRIKSLQVPGPGRGRGLLQGHPSQPVPRLLGRVQRIPPVHARRRSALPRLAAVCPVRPLLRQALRGRDQPALPPGARHQPVDGLPLGRRTARANMPGRWRPRSPTSSRPSATRSA